MIWRVVVIAVALLGVATAQFMLVWNTGPATATPDPFVPGVFNQACVDKIPNCKSYGEAGCKGQYATWAKTNCPNFCKFCSGPTQAPPPCVDTIDTCKTYDKSICSDPGFKSWAEDKCRYYCRLCPPSQLAVIDSHITTMSPQACKDKVDCRLYGQKSCTGTYAVWAEENCPAYCGICTGVATPPPACVDKNPSCSSYKKETCTDPQYKMWIEDNCRQYCGKCQGSGPSFQTQSPLYPVPPQPGKRHGDI